MTENRNAGLLLAAPGLATIVLTGFALLGAPGWAQSPATKAPYPAMAPLERYLMPSRDAEIALARSAAPKSVADGAEVMVLGKGGYTIAVKGGNGFVCMVERAWASRPDDPQFWNPRLRGPICHNPPAARSYLPIMLLKTQLVLAGKSKDEMSHAIAAALDSKQLPALEPGAMSYMLSKQQYLGDDAGAWHPHLMFFMPRAPAQRWGADVPGSPVLSGDDPQDRMIVIMVPVGHWSDGTADAYPL